MFCGWGCVQICSKQLNVCIQSSERSISKDMGHFVPVFIVELDDAPKTCKCRFVPFVGQTFNGYKPDCATDNDEKTYIANKEVVDT